MAIDSNKLELLTKDKSLDALKLLLEHLQDQYGVEAEQILEVISGKQENTGIPLTAFAAEKLSSLEIIVKYLKEDMCRSYHEIASILNRNDRTIWSTYSNSVKKHQSRLSASKTSTYIPISIFSSRTHSVLESLIIYLKENQGYSFSDIANIIHRDYQTVYTTYRRGRAGKHEKQ